MNFDDYQKLAQRTSSTKTRSAKLENGILGLCGEAGECADVYKKYLYQGHEMDWDKLLDEVSDVLWYIAELSCAIGVPLESIAQHNIDKLRKRYPDGFDPERSVHREA